MKSNSNSQRSHNGTNFTHPHPFRFSLGSLRKWTVAGITSAALGMLLSIGEAGVITKADGTLTLDLGGSWVGAVAPSSGDTANWSGSYATAGTLSSSFANTSNVSWQGISIGSISGAAAGAVNIGGTASQSATNTTLTIGTSGIDMSAANQNALINVSTLVIAGASQTWNVATGRNLRLQNSGSSAANANVDGTAGTVITVTGGGVVDLNQGGSSEFADAAGFGGFNGKWIVGTGTTLRAIRNGATAFGTNSASDAITLSGGTLAVGGVSGTQGNWTWNTNITLTASTNSVVDQQLFTGAGRSLKLMGSISGSGNLTFKESGSNNSFDNDDLGYIVTGTNSLSGTVTIGGATENSIVGRLTSLRLGGNTGAPDVTTTAGATGDLGTAQVVNNGVLTLSHNNTWTMGNAISGTGSIRVGGPSGTATQIVTLSGTNSYSGTTTINAGTLILSGGSAIGDSSNVILGTNSDVILLLNSNETMAGLSGGGTTGGTVNINGQTLTVTPPVAHSDFNGALTGSGTVVKSGANQLRLGGTNTFSGTHQIDAGLVIFTSTGSDNGLPNVIMNGDANSGLVIGDVFAGGELTIGSLSGTGGKVRVDWNAAPGQRTLSVTQSVDTTFAGTLEDFTAGRIVGLKKNGSGILTLTTSQPYTGTTNITGGTLALSGSASLSDSAAVSLTASGTVFDIAGITGPTTEKIGSLSGTVGSMVHLGGNTLEFGDATNTSFSGVADGTGGGLKKVGSGTLTLNGTTTNTYTGTTSLVGGTLLLGNNDVLPNAAPFGLSDGTTFSTGGFNETTGSFALAGNAVIDLVGGTSVLTFSNIDSWSGVLSVWNWNGTLNTAGSPANTRLIFSAGSLTSEQLSNIHFYSGGSGSQEVGSGGAFIGNELVAVPEPTSLSASAMLVAWMLCGGRRRTKVQTHSAI